MILAMVAAFLREDEVIMSLNGHLVIVEPARIRVRPA